LDSFELIVKHDLFSSDGVNFLCIVEVDAASKFNLEGYNNRRFPRTVVEK